MLALKALSTSSPSGESTVSLDDGSHCTLKIFITVAMIWQFQIKKAVSEVDVDAKNTVIRLGRVHVAEDLESLTNLRKSSRSSGLLF